MRTICLINCKVFAGVVEWGGGGWGQGARGPWPPKNSSGRAKVNYPPPPNFDHWPSSRGLAREELISLLILDCKAEDSDQFP